MTEKIPLPVMTPEQQAELMKGMAEVRDAAKEDWLEMMRNLARERPDLVGPALIQENAGCLAAATFLVGYCAGMESKTGIVGS